MSALRNILLAFGSFVLCGTLAAVAIDRPSQTTKTLNYLGAHGDEVEIIFLGPSYVAQGLIPSVFDAELARRGYTLRSFNFGLTAMGGPEQRELSHRLLSLELPRLSWIFFDQTLGPWPRTGKNFYKARVIEWHTWRSLFWMERNGLIFGAKRLDHFLNALARGTGLGVGVARLRQQAPFADVTLAAPPSYWTSAEGKPLQRRKLSPERHAEMSDKMDRCRAGARPTIAGRQVMETVAMLKGTGVRGAFVVAPVSYRCSRADEEVTLARRLPLFSFDDPARYPNLYRRGDRVSENHLNYRGSVEYSTALAERFADFLDQDAEPHPPQAID